MPMIESIWLQPGPFMRIALLYIGTFYGVDRHKEIIAALHDRNLEYLLRAIKRFNMVEKCSRVEDAGL
jgi:hypothetical protein